MLDLSTENSAHLKERSSMLPLQRTHLQVCESPADLLMVMRWTNQLLLLTARSVDR